MTNQSDPQDPNRPRDYIDNYQERRGIGAILGALVIIAILGFLFFGLSNDRSGDPVTPRSPGATAPTAAPPAATPPAAPSTGNKQP